MDGSAAVLLFLGIVMLWLVPIYVADRLAEVKGYGTSIGVPLGLLGWLGVLIAAVMPAKPTTPEQPAVSTRTTAWAPAAVASDGAPSSIADEIGKLGRLREQGLISDDEFTSQKAKLLGT